MRATGSTTLAAGVLFAVLGGHGIARAQQPKPISPGWARLSLFGSAASSTPAEGPAFGFGEVVTTLAVQSPTREDGAGTEYRADLRVAGYPGVESRAARVSIYEAWVERRFDAGFGIRAGQMWLTELGASGAVGGGLVEYRRRKPLGGLKLRAALFGGLEPEVLEAGYVSGVRKLGGFVALDGTGARRHVVGFVNVKNQALTERSVLVVSNFVPAGQRFFMYQSAEVDVSRAGGKGGGLSYFFANLRVSPNDVVDLQGTVSRGRSVDTRSIVQDLLSGRPIDSRSLDGFLYESIGGRVTVRVVKGVRVFGGGSVDRNNRDDARTTRLNGGVFASNLFGTGLDLQVSDTRYHAPSSSYDSWYLSVGRQVGTRTYLTGDYSSSLSVLRPSATDVFRIETRPRTQRFGGSAIVNLDRHLSLLLNGEIVRDLNLNERRMMAGVTYRF